MKLTSLVAGAALALGLASVATAQDDPVKVGFVYVGPVGDYGWSYEHNEGRLAVEEAFGDKVEPTFVESVPEGADAERVMTQMALSGHDLIFTTSFGYMDSTIAVAEKFPDVKFEHATGYKRADNVATYSSRFYEGRYVLGQIAAAQSKTGEAGYIASFPIPEVIRGINAFILGAQTVDPDFKLKIIWVNTWVDPAKEADAAKALGRSDIVLLGKEGDTSGLEEIASGNVTATENTSPFLMGKAAMHATLDALQGTYPGGWIETPTSIEDKDGAISVLQEPEKLFPQPSREY